MRISDWSSDVCSSDLAGGVSGGELRELVEGVLDGDIAREGDRFLSHDREGAGSGKVAANQAGSGNDDGILRGSGVGDVGRFDAVRFDRRRQRLLRDRRWAGQDRAEIGRTACRARGFQNVWIWVGAA